MSNPVVNHKLPQYVDGLRLCQQEASLAGTVDVAKLPRLAAVVSRQEGLADASLRFRLDEQQRKIVDGEVSALLPMVCQRCLQEMEWPISAAFEWALVWSDEQAAQLPRSLDALLVEEGEVDLYAALEEEILLALPLAVQHEPGQCVAPAQSGNVDSGEAVSVKENPFQALAGLKDAIKLRGEEGS